MRRRSLLRVGAASLTLPAVGRVAARPPTERAYEPIASVDVDHAAEVVVDADATTAYVAATDGFATVDVSSPASPTVLAERRDLAPDGQSESLGSILDVKVDGDRLLVPGPAQRGQLSGFFVYDVSDPANPQQVGDFFATDHSIHNAMFVDGYAWLQAGAEMHVVDASEPPYESVARWSPVDANDAWQEVGMYTRILHDLWVQDDRAYLAHWDAGVFVLDVADPANPEYLGRFGDYTLAQLREWDSTQAREEYLTPAGNAHYVATDESGTLAAVGAEAWARDGEGGPGGIDLYDVSDPAAAEKLSTIHPPGSPNNSRQGTWTTSHNFELGGEKLYSSWYVGGVMIHDVSEPTAPERIAWWRNLDDAFWTAQVGVPDEFFVATTTGRAAETSRLYTFPDEAGEQADPPAEITEPQPPTVGGATMTTDTPETAADETATNGDDEDDGDDPEALPGMGALTALGGLGVAAWRLRSGGDEE